MMNPFLTQVLLTSFITPHLHLSLKSQAFLIVCVVNELATYDLHASFNTSNLTLDYLLLDSQYFFGAKPRQRAVVSLDYPFQSHAEIFFEEF